MSKTYKVIFDETKTYEIEVKQNQNKMQGR